ncbi:cupin domain-containing protein [Amycolatopsis sulphurea]|uniref:cupin domain-containing protein n=1 Tax=Amycolatopsis sulphurea TaxID=76022 RepID=UPI0024823753|nr:cupin domain-containing protein [Amycolatopsis sulphurea]
MVGSPARPTRCERRCNWCYPASSPRHTPAALCFVIEGGGWTDVDGTRYPMSPGDVIRTPNWAWHGQAATATTSMIWLDGLDPPMIHDLPAGFAESEQPPESPAPPGIRPHAFPFAAMQAELEAGRSDAGDPFDDLIVEYRDPVTGGPIMPPFRGHAAIAPWHANCRASALAQCCLPRGLRLWYVHSGLTSAGTGQGRHLHRASVGGA